MARRWPGPYGEDVEHPLHDLPENLPVHTRIAALRRAALALAMAAAIVPAVASTPAHAASYSGFYTDFSSMELMRLTNKDRVSLGRRPLKVDKYLASLARDMEFTCPSTGTVYRGRARDMAARGYLGHAVKGCGSYTVQNITHRAGYGTYVGENIGQNNWPDTGAVYKVGCSTSGSSCKGSTTSTSPVATIEKMWMRSSGHRSNILNTSYDRFGCGAWDTSGGTKYFACIFAKGGPKPIDGTFPTVADTADNTAHLQSSDDIRIEATFADGFRLSDGWVYLDGVKRRGWSYDLNTTSATETLVVHPSSLKRGTHVVVWAVRDVAGHVTRRKVTFETN
jgi:uncharacterized protein YkwD